MLAHRNPCHEAPDSQFACCCCIQVIDVLQHPTGNLSGLLLFFFFGKAAVAPRCFLVTISEQLNRADFRPVTRTKSSVWVSANHRYVYVCTYVSQAMYYVGICKKCVMFTLCILYLTIKLGGGGLGGSVTSKEAAKLVTIIIRQLDFSAFVVCRQPIMFSSTQPSLYVPKPNQNMGTVLWQERNR